jgi:tetratricopeptide (TPR) repeat protein
MLPLSPSDAMHIYRATIRHSSASIKVPLAPRVLASFALAIGTPLIFTSPTPAQQPPATSAPVVRARPKTPLAPRTVSGPAAQEQSKELNRQAIALQSQGKLTEACALYRQAIGLYPAGAGYHNNLALVLKDLDQSKEAEAQERIALKLRPNRADYHVNLGIILQRQKRLNEDASDSDCHYRLGQVYLELGDFDKAVEVTKLALMLKPDNADYCELMGDIYTKKEKYDDALLEYRRVIELNGYTPATISGALHDKIEFLKSRLKSHN